MVSNLYFVYQHLPVTLNEIVHGFSSKISSSSNFVVKKIYFQDTLLKVTKNNEQFMSII